jgi:hypothetical protein
MVLIFIAKTLIYRSVFKTKFVVRKMEGGDVDLELVECGEKLGREDTHFSQRVSYDWLLGHLCFFYQGIPQLQSPDTVPFLCVCACVFLL